MTSQGEFQHRKLIMVGDSSVGKTCILSRLTNDSFHYETNSTIGASNARKVVKSPYGDSILFNIWDTAGQEKYRSLTPMYFTNASIAILTFDITNESSFNVLDEFVDLLDEQAPKSCQRVLVGNKSDLESERVISHQDASHYAEVIGAAFYMETSAKENLNIKTLFEACANLPYVSEPCYEETLLSVDTVPEQSSCSC